jgi:HTH-type transcriptional regulator/antitoxin HipB
MDYTIYFADQLKPHLRSLRKARSLTQAQLAQRLGVVQSRIATIESKPETISVEHLFKVLAALAACRTFPLIPDNPATL